MGHVSLGATEQPELWVRKVNIFKTSVKKRIKRIQDCPKSEISRRWKTYENIEYLWNTLGVEWCRSAQEPDKDRFNTLKQILSCRAFYLHRHLYDNDFSISSPIWKLPRTEACHGVEIRTATHNTHFLQHSQLTSWAFTSQVISLSERPKKDS